MSAALPLVEAIGVERTYGNGPLATAALLDLNLRIFPGERVAVTGPSGAGKSTLLNLLGALDRNYQGSLRLDGHELGGLGDRELSALRNRTVGFVFQSFNLLPSLRVGANLTMPSAFARDISLAVATKRARMLLERVGLAGTWNKRPLELSGGQRQRVAIARALVLEPRLLLGDEPTGSLDRAHADDVLDLFDELAASSGCALVLVTHDPIVERRMDRVLRFEAGRLVSDGPPIATDGAGRSGEGRP
jgi:ABC-type lipoprotein export system ATPase subunit